MSKLFQKYKGLLLVLFLGLFISLVDGYVLSGQFKGVEEYKHFIYIAALLIGPCGCIKHFTQGRPSRRISLIFAEKRCSIFQKKHIDALAIRYKNNLINSISGYKSANLIGTKGKAGNTNLAVFNSIVHLGSNPALLGFILRPTTVPRHSYQNMKETGVFTINHISKDQIEDAHHTSAKYPENVSEFDQTNLKEEYKADCFAPFVKDAPVQIACRYVNDYLIKENDTLLVVGAVEHLFVKDEMLLEDGYVQLDKGEVVTVNGIDGYALPQLLARFPYARPKE